MVAESTVQDFYKKLEENVTSDKLIWFFSPKRYNEKEFSGTLIKNLLKFTLTQFTQHTEQLTSLVITKKKEIIMKLIMK